MDKNDLKALLMEMGKISYVKPQEIPDIDLYMDQVTTFMDQHLVSTKRYEEDKLLTKTMINNYTKNDLLPSPHKKKYSKNHMYILIYIYYLKNFLSITDIQTLLHPLTELFFENEGEISLERLYNEIYKIEIDQAYSTAKDIIKQREVADKMFENVKNDEEKEFLKKFAYACLLSYDIYTKRQMLLKFLDTEFPQNNEKKSSEPEKSSKEEKKEKEREKDKEKEKERAEKDKEKEKERAEKDKEKEKEKSEKEKEKEKERAEKEKAKEKEKAEKKD